MNVPAGRYQYVKINRWKDRKIDAGQAMFMPDPKTFEVTTHGELSCCVGVSLQFHRYHLWEYALWLITRMIRFSPVRYVFIQQSGNIKFQALNPMPPQNMPSMVEFTQEMPIEEAKRRWPNTPIPNKEDK